VRPTPGLLPSLQKPSSFNNSCIVSGLRYVKIAQHPQPSAARPTLASFDPSKSHPPSKFLHRKPLTIRENNATSPNPQRRGQPWPPSIPPKAILLQNSRIVSGLRCLKNGPRIQARQWRNSCSNSPIMITGFAPRISRDDYLRVTVFLLRVLSLGAAVGYAIAGR
jgi:hypothetical protein